MFGVALFFDKEVFDELHDVIVLVGEVDKADSGGHVFFSAGIHGDAVGNSFFAIEVDGFDNRAVLFISEQV